jgi:hypothetical protein
MELEPLILVNNGVVSGALPGRSRHGPRAQVDTRHHVGRMIHDQQSLLSVWPLFILVRGTGLRRVLRSNV